MAHKARLSLLSLLTALLVAAGWLWVLSNQLDAHSPRFLRGKPANIDIFYSNGAPLGTALIYLDTRAILAGPILFSIYFDLNRDGIFDPIEELGVGQVPAFPEEEVPIGFPVTFDKATDPSVQSLALQVATHHIPIRVVLSTLTDPGTPVEVDEVTAKSNQVEISGIFSPEGSLIGSSAAWVPIFSDPSSAADLFAWLERLLMPPTVHAQQQSGIRKGVPDINARTGKQNECVPISVANSLRWLETQPKFAGNLPKDDKKGDNVLLDELDTALGWTNKGVKRDDFLAGKNTFTSDHQLSLDNERLDATFTPDTGSNICSLIQQELNKGEDVELVIDFKTTPQTATENAAASHAVTVVGFTPMTNGRCSVAVHDSFTMSKKPTTENYTVGRDGRIDHPIGGTTNPKTSGFGVLIFSESIKSGT